MTINPFTMKASLSARKTGLSVGEMSFFRMIQTLLKQPRTLFSSVLASSGSPESVLPREMM